MSQQEGSLHLLQIILITKEIIARVLGGYDKLINIIIYKYISFTLKSVIPNLYNRKISVKIYTGFHSLFFC